jgi:hypothetical protein
MPVRRSAEVVTTALFLSRFSERSEGGRSLPPRELRASDWNRAYDLFYQVLADGRSRATFANTLKNSRDVFDAHVPDSSRVGWRASEVGRPPEPLSRPFAEIWNRWRNTPRTEFFEAIRQWIVWDSVTESETPTRIPEGITREDVLNAIRTLDSGAFHEFGESTKYDLVFNSRRYPPKAVLGLAAERLVGRPLRPRDFTGGMESRSSRTLVSLGFEVVEKPPRSEVAYWALCANPSRYRVEDAVRNLDSDWWTTGGKPLKQGDRVAIWKAAGHHGPRGIVAFGTVLGNPELRADTGNPFWLTPEVSARQEERVPIRYFATPHLPAWLDGPHSNVLQELAVARARGGTVFRISPDQWSKLSDALEAPSDFEIGVRAQDASEPGRRRTRGQGRGLSPEQRRAVEQFAMSEARRTLESQGWTVMDVSATRCYDLLCTHDDQELHVEVKGTTSTGNTVLVTKGEVQHIRRCNSHGLFVVSEISVVTTIDAGSMASGGKRTWIFPLDLRHHRLTAVTFELAVQPTRTDIQDEQREEADVEERQATSGIVNFEAT